jgi:hypothetical protein
MTELEQILKEAESALSASSQEDDNTHRAAMTKFMAAMKRIARMVVAGNATWDAVRPWAKHNANQVISARRGFEDWSGETYRIFYGGGEEEAERALERRSLLEFVLTLFRGTEAEEWLDGFETDDVDQDYREQAEQCGLDPPDWVPPSHTWWRWRKQ